MTQAKSFEKTGDKQDADAVLQVSISANEDIYEEIKRRDPIMCDALMTLMKPEMEAEFNKMEAEFDKREEASTLKKIKSVMEKLKYSAEQAMELLDIPAKDQDKYMKMI